MTYAMRYAAALHDGGRCFRIEPPPSANCVRVYLWALLFPCCPCGFELGSACGVGEKRDCRCFLKPGQVTNIMSTPAELVAFETPTWSAASVLAFMVSSEHGKVGWGHPRNPL